MSLIIKGKITHVLESRTGTSDKGDWAVQNFVLQETEGDYPKSINFEAFNKEWDLREGQEVEVSINLESREWQGRWFLSAKAWKFTPIGGQAAVSQAAPEPQAQGADTETDDLPF